MWNHMLEQVREGRHINVVIDDLRILDKVVVTKNDSVVMYLRNEKDALAFLALVAVELEHLPFAAKHPTFTFWLDHDLGPSSDVRRVVKFLISLVKNNILEHRYMNAVVLTDNPVGRDWICDRLGSVMNKRDIGFPISGVVVGSLDQERPVYKKGFDNRVR